MPPLTPLVERFWPKVKKTDGCWDWQATLDQCGYGLIGYNRRVIRAHRACWMLIHGEIPKGMQVLHTCDRPQCVNPEHLWLGTHKDNMADMRRKGRGPLVEHRQRVRGQFV